MWLLVGLLITVVLLMLIGTILPGLRIDGPGPALIAAVIARVISMVAGLLVAPALAPYITGGGAVSVPIAALLVVGLRFGAMFGIQSAMFEARNSVIGGGPFGF